MRGGDDMTKCDGTQAPPKRGSGVKAVTGSTSTTRIGTAKGKKPKSYR